MCGIAVSWDPAHVVSVPRMLDKMQHRGPDSDGLSADGDRVVGHRRLSIIDVSGGDQPLWNETRTHALVANGEIYNAPALRERLSRDHEFRTRSDNEVILHLHEDGGPESLAELDGMFAFAIRHGNQLLAARDPLGIKPLYHGRSGSGWVFASEIKALVGEASDIQEFPPGCWFSPGSGFQPYYRVPQPLPDSAPWEEHASRLRRSLEQAVHKRLMSDVPLGVFLSGGLDSSAIAALVAREIDDLHTFSVGVPGSSDLLAARKVAEHLGTHHHEFPLTAADVIEHLPRIIHHLESFDQDLVRSAIPCYFVSRLASEHVKVVLSGEGADELFAGYGYYQSYVDPVALDDELRRSVESLHDINLQRVDRMTMAHSIEGRVPFLDLDVVETAFRIPPELKLRSDDAAPCRDKWILRKACEDLLPERVVWRRKEQFDEGSGTVDLLGDLVIRLFPDRATRDHVSQHAGTSIRSKDEAVYHRIFCDVFPEAGVVEAVVSRWSEGRMSGC